MKYEQVLDLIREGVNPRDGSIWAELGCGSGDFTMALDDLLGIEAAIFAIDTSLSVLKKRLQTRYMKSTVHLYEQNFTHPIDFLPILDGILMANALHFVSKPDEFLHSFKKHLRPGGAFLLVEYDREEISDWIPYPMPFKRWQQVVKTVGFSAPKELNRVPSVYGRCDIYAAVCYLL